MIDSSTTPPVDAGPSIAVPLVEPAPSNTPEPSPTAETPPGPSLLHLALGLDGRASAGLDVQRGAAGAAAALALGIGERWGVEAQVAADLPFTASAAEGGAQLARQTLALRGLLRLQLASGPRVALRLEAGPLLERVSASSSGYAVTRSTAVLDVGLELALALELRLGRRVALELGPALQGMAHRSRFVVENVGPIVTLPSVWGGLAAGVRFDFL